MLARRGYREVNIVGFSGHFSLKNVLLMQSAPFAKEGAGTQELGVWHKPIPSFWEGIGIQSYTLTRRKQRFSSKPGQDSGDFLCRSHHSDFKRWELIPGTLKFQEVGWWFQQEQNLVVTLTFKAWPCPWGCWDLLNPTNFQRIGTLALPFPSAFKDSLPPCSSTIYLLWVVSLPSLLLKVGL